MAVRPVRRAASACLLLARVLLSEQRGVRAQVGESDDSDSGAESERDRPMEPTHSVAGGEKKKKKRARTTEQKAARRRGP